MDALISAVGGFGWLVVNPVSATAVFVMALVAHGRAADSAVLRRRRMKLVVSLAAFAGATGVVYWQFAAGIGEANANGNGYTTAGEYLWMFGAGVAGVATVAMSIWLITQSRADRVAARSRGIEPDGVPGATT